MRPPHQRRRFFQQSPLRQVVIQPRPTPATGRRVAAPFMYATLASAHAACACASGDAPRSSSTRGAIAPRAASTGRTR